MDSVWSAMSGYGNTFSTANIALTACSAQRRRRVAGGFLADAPPSPRAARRSVLSLNAAIVLIIAIFTLPPVPLTAACGGRIPPR